MSAFEFEPWDPPFPRWWGPFSPARGIYTGFRFCRGQFGTYVIDDDIRLFWPVYYSPGVQALTRLVTRHYGGGRVLLLPNGLVIKPLQDNDERAKRVVIGEFAGSLVLQRPDGVPFNLAAPGPLAPGADWAGPKMTGLECTHKSDGSLWCTWYHPAEYGRDEITYQVVGPDRQRAAGFRKAKQGNDSGRVRVTANGHVITNCQTRYNTWSCRYVGCIDTEAWPHFDEWIED